ncbi:MAG: hypothetical protein ACMUIU_00435 [bacterium]
MEQTLKTLFEGPGGQHRKGLIQDDKVRLLKKGPYPVKAAFLSMGELPPGLSNSL